MQQETSSTNKWNELTSSEKAVISLYVSALAKNEVSRELVMKVNEIHSKYEGFFLDCVPQNITERYGQFSDGPAKIL